MRSITTKNKILTSAAELFAKHGYYKVSVREICEKAEITKPSLYYYFKDKETLLEELMNETQRCVDSLVVKHVEKESRLPEILNGIVEVYLEFLSNYPHLTRFSAFIQATNVPPKILEMKKERFVNEMGKFNTILNINQSAGILSPKYDTNILAKNFIGTILIILLEHLMFSNELADLEIKLRNFVNFWIKTFLDIESPEQ